MPINCFLSHAHRDKPFADRLADTLAGRTEAINRGFDLNKVQQAA